MNSVIKINSASPRATGGGNYLKENNCTWGGGVSLKRARSNKGLEGGSKIRNFERTYFLNARVKRLEFLTFLKLNHGTVQFLLTIYHCEMRCYL